MSLRFEKLRIENFGPYYGVQEVNLQTTSDAPVVVIHGENTLGKTQLFAALRWCLYGTFEPQQSDGDALRAVSSRLNRLAAREGERVLEVGIVFDVEGETYALSRRATLGPGIPNIVANLRIGASVVARGQIDVEIGKQLHPQISEFFLFDAELLQRFYDRLNSDRERSFIRGSIESVLGIPALQLAKRDVASLAGDALSRQAKAAKNQSEAERFNRRLRVLRDEEESAARDHEETVRALNDAESRLKENRQRLKRVEGLQADVREQEVLIAQIAGGERDDTRYREELRQMLAEGWIAVAARPLRNALSRVQERNSRVQLREEAITLARQRVVVLEDRARGGDCVACRQPLPPVDAATAGELKEAQVELSKLLEETGGGHVDLQLERRVAGLVDEGTALRYVEADRRVNELAMLQYQRRQALEGIADRLEGNSAADIRMLASETRRLDGAVVQAKKDMERIERKRQAVASEQQKLARQLQRLPSAKSEVAVEASLFAYMDAVLDATIGAYRERVRGDVEKSAQEMFLRLVRDPAGYGGLRIESDYRIELLDNHGEARETSEGGKQLLALSLIKALKEAAVRGGPVVIDSPLGRLDLEHRANVLQAWVPALGSQAILLVQSGELTQDDAHKLLGAQIGREYRIVRPSRDPEVAVIEGVR